MPKQNIYSNEVGYKTYAKVKTITCPQCGKEHTRYFMEIAYLAKHNNKLLEFCCYTCRQKYVRENKGAISGPFTKATLDRMR